jgi:1,2-diacylglycerol 3-alpha-glucosyltransferase
MRVGFFTDTFLPNKDGVVVSLLNFRNELEKRGNKVFVFSSGDPKLSKGEVYYYRSVPFPPYPMYKIALFPYTAKREAKKNRIQLIHCHAIASMGLAAVKTARDLELSLVGSFHTMIPEATHYITHRKWSEKLAEKIAWRAIKAFYKPFDLVTAPSNAVKKLLVEQKIENVEVVPNGIDVNRFNPSLAREPVRTILGIQPQQKMVLVLGRLVQEKNVDVIVDAAKHVLKQVDAKFVVVGEGPARQWYEHLVAEKRLQEKFFFTGLVNDFELPFFYSAADAFCTASTFETQCLTVLEAMACGKPVVGADALAIPEAVKQGKNGFLFKPIDPLDCAQKIVEALSMPESRLAQFSKNARETALNYSVEKTTDRLLAVYEKVL